MPLSLQHAPASSVGIACISQGSNIMRMPAPREFEHQTVVWSPRHISCIMRRYAASHVHTTADYALASQWEREQAVQQRHDREREEAQRRAATEAHRAALRHDRWQHRSMTETSLHERTAPIAMSLGLCCLQGPKVQLKRTELIDDTDAGGVV